MKKILLIICLLFLCSCKKNVSLKEYLKMISFVIDNYSPSCKYYKDSNLYLEISAKIDEEKSVTYKVPIKFNNC